MQYKKKTISKCEIIETRARKIKMLKIIEIFKNLKHRIDNKRLHMDLELQVARIRDENYKKIMNKLISYVSTAEEHKTGLLLTPREARERAEALFKVGKFTGTVDAMNNLVKKMR